MEALLILPAHLSSRQIIKPNFISKAAERLRLAVGGRVEKFVSNHFVNWVENAVRYRYVTFCGALAILIMTIGLIAGGFIGFTFIDPVEADNMLAWLTMPQGTPAEQTIEIATHMKEAAWKVRDEIDARHPNGIPQSVVVFGVFRIHADCQDNHRFRSAAQGFGCGSRPDRGGGLLRRRWRSGGAAGLGCECVFSGGCWFFYEFCRRWFGYGRCVGRQFQPRTERCAPLLFESRISY